MKMMRDARSAGIVAATVAMLTLGFSSYAHAEDVTDFKVCFDGSQYTNPYWTGFCSAVAKLPIGFPELSFGFGQFDTLAAQITVDGNGTLEIRAKLSAVYFDAPGHNQYGPDASLVLRARVDANGKLIGGAGGGACDGTPDDLEDFCVQGTVINPATGIPQTGKLIAGKFGVSKGFGYKKAAITHVECPDGVYDPVTFQCVSPVSTPYDDFEFYFETTGGVLFADINGTYGPNFLMEGFANSSYVPANPFAAGSSFNAPYIWGIASPTVAVAADALLNPCTGQIKGSVTDYFSAGSVLGSAVSVTGLLGTSQTIPADSGAFASTPNLCADTYTVTVVPPVGYSVYGANAASVPLATSNSVVSGVNFKLYSSPISTAAFMTFNQAGWGTKPKGQNAGQLLATYFNFLYPTGEMMIGLPDTDPDPAKCKPYSITETGAAGVQDFLPQEGKPLPLSACWIDPPSRFKPQHKNKTAHHRRLGALAGETLALELNVRFSAYSLTKHGLGELHLVSGALMGKTVNDVLAIANTVLGGGALPTGLKNYDALEDIVERINKNYQAGTTDAGYLKP